MASGTLLDMVQVGAWARMWVGHLQTESVGGAFARTFTEEGMCEVCQTVQAVKKDQTEKFPFTVQSAERTFLLPLKLSSVTIDHPAGDKPRPRLENQQGTALKTSPPVPPPRV